MKALLIDLDPSHMYYVMLFKCVFNDQVSKDRGITKDQDS